MEDFKQGQLNKIQMPYFRINKSSIEKMMFNLHDYITPVYPGESAKSIFQKPKYTLPNYFDSEKDKVCFIDVERKLI